MDDTDLDDLEPAPLKVTSVQANYVENVTAEWAAGGINHEIPTSVGNEEILRITTNGFGRLFLQDSANNILVSFASDSPDAIALATNYMNDFLNAPN